MKTAPAWLLEQVPAGEDLDRLRLAELATALGREEGLWRNLVRHYQDERYFAQLYRDSHLDVWLICWLNQQDTGYHDHDVSAGAVYVCEGMLAEDRFHFDGSAIHETTRERVAGTVFDFDAAHIHRLRHPGGAPATSIHFYSPALWRMGYYEWSPSGDLCRTSITYADEVGAIEPWC